MISSVSEVLTALTAALRSRLDLVFEHLELSHQVMVMQRSRRKPQFGGADRFLWILQSTVWNRWSKALVVAQPATVLRWRDGRGLGSAGDEPKVGASLGPRGEQLQRDRLKIGDQIGRASCRER